MKFKSRKAGFSLVEMAIVLTIIGVVVASSVSMFRSNVDVAKYNDTQDKISTIKTALNRFYAANNRLPCPSQLTKKVGDVGTGTNGDASYGEEIYAGLCDIAYTPANTTVPAGTYKIGAAGTFVYKGALPTHALALQDNMMYDGYGINLHML